MPTAPLLPATRDVRVPYALLVTCACALFAWLTPNHEPPWASFHGEMAMAVAAVVLVPWVLWRTWRRALAIPALALFTFAAALIPLVQLAGGAIESRGIALLASMYVAGFAIVQVAGFRAVEEWGHEGVLQAFAGLVLVGSLASVWLALYQWQQLDYLSFYTTQLAEGARAGANFNQPNQLATMLVLGLAATAALYDARRFGSAVALGLVLLLGFGLAMTQSRAGLVEVVVVGALLIAKRRKLSRRLTATRGLVGVVLVLLMPLAWKAANTGMGHAVERSATAMAEAGTRIPHWLSVLDAIHRAPWLGYGWNGTILAQFAVAPDHVATHEVLGFSHNIVLDLMVWNGVPLGLAFAGGLGLWFIVALRGARDSSALLGLAAVVAVFVHALLEYPLYYVYFLLPVGLVMGAISAVTMPQAVVGRVSTGWAILPMVVITGALAVVISDYLALEQDVSSLRLEQARIGIHRPKHVLSEPLLLTQLGAFLKFASTPEREAMSGAELQAMKDVVKRYPSGINLVRYSAALALNGQQVEAAQMLRRVCKLESADTCKAVQGLWIALGKRQPGIAATAWPKE